MPSPIIIVGAGISGMLTAALLRQRQPDRPITIIEQAGRAGGLYTSVDYGEGGYFDYGMHILYDTGIEEIDTLIHGLLPENEWHMLEGNRKDIAGIFYNRTLQQYSPYVDLRHLPEQEHQACVRGVYSAAEEEASPPADAAGYFSSRFGAPAASYLSDIISNRYQVPASEVSYLATCQPAMDRVLLFDKERMPPILQSETLRARIGYPDQLALPPVRTGNQRGWYPKKFGMIHVVDALKRRLAEQGVDVVLNARIERFERDGDRIDSLRIETAGGCSTLDNIDRLYWTAGWPGLAALLGIPALFEQRGTNAAHIHLRFREAPQMGELYHFYCFDPGYRTFRVTHYANYCPAARNALGYPICVEYWPRDDESPEHYMANALRELRSFGIVSDTPVFQAMQMVPNYHRLFLLHTVEAIESTRVKLQGMDIRNLAHIGVLANGGELLFYEIMRAAHAQLR